MDYKELIERLIEENQSLAAYEDLTLAHVLEDATLAIETLLSELDAAAEILRAGKSRCDYCIHNESSIHEYPCRDCKDYGGMSDYWQWSGLQDKE